MNENAKDGAVIASIAADARGRRMNLAVIAWFGMAVTLLARDSVDAALLCQTKSGTLKVRDACKPRETPADPAALGLQGPPGPPGTGLVLKDSQGVTVGPYVPESFGSEESRVAIAVADRVALLRLGAVSHGTGGTDGIYPTLGAEAGAFHYTTADCSGTALFPVDGSAVTFAFRLGNVLYAPAATGSPTTILSAELRPLTAAECSESASGGETATFTPPDRCCVAGGAGFPTTATEAPPLTRTISFAPPFHVEVP